MKIYQASPPALLYCSHSGVGEPAWGWGYWFYLQFTTFIRPYYIPHFHFMLAGLYITFSISGTISLAKVENMAAMQLFTLGGSGSVLPRNFGDFRCSEVHSEAHREPHRASWEETHHHNHHCLLSYWNTGNHLHCLGSILMIYSGLPETICRWSGLSVVKLVKLAR